MLQKVSVEEMILSFWRPLATNYFLKLKAFQLKEENYSQKRCFWIIYGIVNISYIEISL